jgi:hypothetical protein
MAAQPVRCGCLDGIDTETDSVKMHLPAAGFDDFGTSFFDDRAAGRHVGRLDRGASGLAERGR